MKVKIVLSQLCFYWLFISHLLLGWYAGIIWRNGRIWTRGVFWNWHNKRTVSLINLNHGKWWSLLTERLRRSSKNQNSCRVFWETVALRSKVNSMSVREIEERGGAWWAHELLMQKVFVSGAKVWPWELTHSGLSCRASLQIKPRKLVLLSTSQTGD